MTRDQRSFIMVYFMIFCMKMDILLVVLVIVFSSTSINHIFAQQNNGQMMPVYNAISVTTNKPTYNSGDAVTIYGKVSHVINNTSLTIQILDPFGNVIIVNQIFPSLDGSFTKTFLNTCSPLWNHSGNYTIHVQYGGYTSPSLTFYYNGCTNIPNRTTNATASNSTLAGQSCKTSFPPSVPTLTWPPNGAVVHGNAITLEWTPVTIPCQTVTYKVEFSTDPTFNTNVKIDSDTLTTNSLTVNRSDSGNFTTYWRVYAQDVVGPSPKSQIFGYTVNIPTTKTGIINAIPYEFSLTAAGSSFHNVKYKVHFNFPNESFNIAKVVVGTFDNFIILPDNTVVFDASDIEAAQSKTGIIAFNFEDNEVKPDRKGIFDITVTANGITKNITKDPGLEEIDTIIQTAKDGFDLALNIYNSTVSCFNLDISDVTTIVGSLNPKYSVNMKNCSEHPEKIHLSASGEINNYVFSGNDMDIGSSSVKDVDLTLFVPQNLPNGLHTFTVKGVTILDIFGYNWNVTYSSGSGLYQIQNNAVIIPEFPESAIIILLVSAFSIIMFSSNKNLNFHK